MTGQQGPRDLPFSGSPVLGIQMHPVWLFKNVGAADPSSGPRACPADTLPAEPSPCLMMPVVFLIVYFTCHELIIPPLIYS